MVNIETKLVHQDVLAIFSFGETLFAAIGGWIYVYKGKTFQSRCLIFHGQKIHSITLGLCNDFLIVLGGKQWALCELSKTGDVKVKDVFKNNDWILDAQEINGNRIVLITSHNEAQIWDKVENKLIKAVSPNERCILYCAKIHSIGDKIFILAGTVFSQVIVWELTNSSQPILYRLKGHKGVIFSINVAVTRNDPVVICTTSDDRSVRLYSGENFQTGCLKEHEPMYAHTARVWKAVTLFDHILTIGEDSLLCTWSYDGQLISKTELHHGGGIHSLTRYNESFLTGGSDGGIFEIFADSLFRHPESFEISIDFLTKEIPRKVTFFGEFGMACLTSKRLLFRCDHGPFKEITDGQEFFPQCTDMASSNNELIGLTTVTGFILIYRFTGNGVKMDMVNENLKCEMLRFRDQFLIVGIANGNIALFETDNLSKVSKYQLPKCKDRSPNCFLRLEIRNIWKTLVGDRNGNLHVYHDGEENPVQTFIRLHSHLGISDIFYRKLDETMLTIGSGGWVKQLAFVNNKLTILKSFAVPMESSVRIIHTTFGIILAGFHGSFLKLWDLEKRLVIGSFQCGGGHRSFDFRSFQNYVNFLFIRDKKMYQVPFNLKFGERIRESFHSKMINCLEILEPGIVVSGGDDNALRITKFGEFDVEPIHVLEQHISSIRAIRVIPVNTNKQIIFSVGGREQICLTEYCVQSKVCREIFSHFPTSSSTEGRFMCVNYLSICEAATFIVVGCSDCTIRVFHCNVSNELSLVGVMMYKNCILNLITVNDFLISFATDGLAVFWDFKNGRIPKEPEFSIPLHQSGINCAVITKKAENEFYLATGGDDNLLSISQLTLSSERQWEMHSRWTSSASHACQITGLVFHDDWLISTSIDQRVVVHRITADSGTIQAEITTEIIVTVPDAHGMTLLQGDSTTITVCVYGKGIETIVINLEPKL